MLRGPVMGSPMEANPATWMKGGPTAKSKVGEYWNPNDEGGVWLICSSNKNLLRRNEKRATATSEGENVCVS